MSFSFLFVIFSSHSLSGYEADNAIIYATTTEIHSRCKMNARKFYKFRQIKRAHVKMSQNFFFCLDEDKKHKIVQLEGQLKLFLATVAIQCLNAQKSIENKSSTDSTSIGNSTVYMHNSSLQTFSQACNLASHATPVVCLNIICEVAVVQQVVCWVIRRKNRVYITDQASK